MDGIHIAGEVIVWGLVIPVVLEKLVEMDASVSITFVP